MLALPTRPRVASAEAPSEAQSGAQSEAQSEALPRTPSVLPSRRLLLQGMAATGVATGLGGAALASPAAAAAATPLLAAADRHLVSRFSYGVTPDLADDVRRAGGGRAWFDAQLSPSGVPDGAADELDSWWPSLTREPADLWKRQVDEVEGGWQVMENYERWTLVRRMRTKRQVHEMMTEFWMHHLNVPANGDAAFLFRTSYDRVVRQHALGRFEDLLFAAITHPAMGIYLSNAVSTKSHPNENLGRELLELHTVGRGAYDEDDVKNSARILTGWNVDMWRTWSAAYQPAKHWTGAVTVMDFSDPNTAADGRETTRRYLSHLARHPETARRIARKLVVKFVRDDVPEALVDRLAEVYRSSGTDISAVLKALVSSAEFKAASSAPKVRDPGEDVVATYRALGVTLQRPPAGSAGRDHAANTVLWQSGSVGARPYSWPQPDGQPIDNASWSSPARLMASFDVHFAMAGGWWPKNGISYRSALDWFPPAGTDAPSSPSSPSAPSSPSGPSAPGAPNQPGRPPKGRGRKKNRKKDRRKGRRSRDRSQGRSGGAKRTSGPSVRFDTLVDHLSRQILHLPASDRLIQACCQAVDVKRTDVIDADHAVAKWNFQRVLATVLDSPAFLSR